MFFYSYFVMKSILLPVRMIKSDLSYSFDETSPFVMGSMKTLERSPAERDSQYVQFIILWVPRCDVRCALLVLEMVIFVSGPRTQFFMQEDRGGVGKKGSTAQTPPRCWLRPV